MKISKFILITATFVLFTFFNSFNIALAQIKATVNLIKTPYFTQNGGPDCWAAAALLLTASVNPSAKNNVNQFVYDAQMFDGINVNNMGSNTKFKEEIKARAGIYPDITVMGYTYNNSQVIAEVKKPLNLGRPVMFCSDHRMESSETNSGHCINIVGYNASGFYVRDPKSMFQKHVLSLVPATYFLNTSSSTKYAVVTIPAALDANRQLQTMQLFTNSIKFISPASKTNKFDEISYYEDSKDSRGYSFQQNSSSGNLGLDNTIPAKYLTLLFNGDCMALNNSDNADGEYYLTIEVGKKDGSKVVKKDFPPVKIKSNNFAYLKNSRVETILQDFRDPKLNTDCYFKIKFIDNASKKTLQDFSQNFILEPAENKLELSYVQTENLFDFTVKSDDYKDAELKYIWTFEDSAQKFKETKIVNNSNKLSYRFIKGGKYKVKLELYKTPTKKNVPDQFLGKKELELSITDYLNIDSKSTGLDYNFKALDQFMIGLAQPQYKWVISSNNTPIITKTIDKSNDFKYTFKDEGEYNISVELLDSTTKETFAVAKTTVKAQKAADDTSQNSKGIKLIVPKDLLGADFVDVKLELSPELEAKTKQIYWVFPGYPYFNNQDIDNKNDKKEIQFQVLNRSYQKQGEVFVRLYDENDKEIEVSDPVVVNITPVGMGISASDIWDVGTDGKNAGGRRKPEVLKRNKDGTQVDSASIGGNISIRWIDQLNTYTDATLRAEYEPLIKSGQYKEMRPLDIQGFKGYLLINPVKTKYSGNQHGYVDIAHPEGEGSVRGFIIKGKESIKIEGSVFGGGTRLGESPNFAYDDMSFVKSQTNTAFNEMISIIESIKIVPDPKRDTFPYKGPSLDGSDTASVKLQAAKTKLSIGDIIQVKAIVENYKQDIAKLKYNWSGEHEGTGNNVNFIATQAGKYTLSIDVEDDNGSIGTASIEFDVDEIKIQINKIAPSADTADFGSEASFSASVLMDDKAAKDNSYIYHWEASENVVFEPQDSSSNTTKVRLNYPDKITFWVNVVKKEGDNSTTIGKSDQIEIIITKPEIFIVADKPQPAIDEEVKATVNTKIDADNISFDWEELPDNAELVSESQDGKEITFVLKDAKPVTLKVTAKTSNNGIELGNAELTITAQEYNVSVEVDGPKYGNIKPVIWKQGTGLIKLTSEYAVNQEINISANINNYKDTDIIFNWKAGEGCNITGNDTGQIVTINRSTTGTCNVTATATTSKGNKLGEGSAELNISISQDDLNTASKIKDQVDQLIKQANTKSETGDLTGGLKDAETAANLNPKDPNLPGLLTNLNIKNQGVKNLITKANDQINSGDLDGAQTTSDEIKKVDANNPALKEIKTNISKKINDNYKYLESKILEIDNVIKVDKEFDLALTMASELRSSQTMNQHFSDWLSREETWAKQQIQNKTRSKGLLSSGESKFNNKDFVAADVDISNGLDTYDVWNKRDTEPQYFGNLRNQSRENIKILGSISTKVIQALTYQGLDPAVIDSAINDGKYAMNLSPVYAPIMPEWIKTLEAKKQALLKLLSDRQNTNSNNIPNTQTQTTKTFKLENNINLTFPIPPGWTYNISNNGDIDFYYNNQGQKNMVQLNYKTYPFTDYNNKNQMLGSVMNGVGKGYKARVSESTANISGQSIPALHSSIIDNSGNPVASRNYFPSNDKLIFVVSSFYAANQDEIPSLPLLNGIVKAISSNSSQPNTVNNIANNNIIPKPQTETIIKYIDNFNTGGCSYTDNAKISLKEPFNTTSLQIWYFWDSYEQSVPYNILKDGSIIASGSFIKGACDPNQNLWCGGDSNQILTLMPGTYDIKLGKARLCQNTTSNNNGFIRVFGSKSLVTHQPVTSTQNNPPPQQTYKAPQSVTPKVLTNKMLNITFTNQSSENVHFYGMGERCSPDNKFSPGGTTNIGMVTQYKILEFYVGRNGQTIGTVKLPVENLKNGQVVELIFSNGVLKIIKPDLQSGEYKPDQGLYKQPYSNTYPVSIVGKWNIVACGYPAILEINDSSGKMIGRINYNNLNNWEPVNNIKYNSSTGQVSFKRIPYPQVHTGIATGNKMEGTLIRYEVPGTPTCKWEASR